MSIIAGVLAPIIEGIISRRPAASAPGAPTFPDTNRVALWLVRNIESQAIIPNSWAATLNDGNLLKNPAHIAGSTAGSLANWFGSSVTMTADQTGPDGKTSGTRAVATGANGAVLSSGQSIQAGTWTLVVPIKSNTGASQSVKIGQSSTLTTHTVTTSWAEYAGVFTLGGVAGGLTIVRDNGAGTMDVIFGTPRLYSGDVSGAIPSAQPLAGHIALGLNETPTLTGTAYLSTTGNQHLMPQFDDGIDLSTGDATYFHIVRRASNPSGIASCQSLRANGVTRHMFGFRGTGRLCHGDGNAQTKHQQAVLLGGHGWQVLGVVVDATANERRFYVGRQLVQILSGIGSNTSSTDRDWALFVQPGGNNLTGDWMGGGMYNRALSATEWAQLVTACEAEIVAHGETVGTTLRTLVLEGDSITSDNAGNVDYYGSKAVSSFSTPALVVNLAVPGDNIEDVDSRRVTRQRYLSDTTNRNYILSFWATNDVELTGYPATYASVGQDIVTEAKADGFGQVIACTLTPKTTANYNTNRATVNASIAAFTGVDAICDFAANTAYGEDADASNATLYPDGAHPSDTVHALMATDFANTVNSL